jgi:FkbM family methyltransferase
MDRIIEMLNHKKVFIQIGTNNGNDNFNKIIRKYKPDKTILVEPNIHLKDNISKNYEGLNNIFIKLSAIDINRGETKLYIPSNKGYSDAHFSMRPMNDWGNSKEELTTITAEGIKFEDLLKEFNIDHINYLQIDTEGFDYEIINSIDFNNINIDIIRFEKWEFSSESFSKFNNLSENLGLNGHKKIMNKLSEFYILKDISDNDGANDIVGISKLILQE